MLMPQRPWLIARLTSTSIVERRTTNFGFAFFAHLKGIPPSESMH